MSWYEQPDPIECPACHGDSREDGFFCTLCQCEGYVTASERREYIADARAEQDRD